MFIEVPTRRVLWLLILLTVLPVSAIGVLSYLRFMQSAAFTVREATGRIVRQAGGGIEGRFEVLRPSVDLLAENQEVREFYSRHQEDPTSALSKMEPRLVQYFERFFEVFGDRYLQVAYLDTLGRPLFKVQRPEEGLPGIGGGRRTILVKAGFAPQDRADPEAYRKLVEGEEAFRAVLMGGSPYGRILRIYRGVHPPGLLMADLRPEALLPEDLASMVFGERGYIAILDREEDRILSHTETPRSGRRLTEAYPALGTRYEGMKRQERGWVRFEADGEEWLVSYVNLRHPVWTVMAAASAEEFLGQPRETGMINLWVTLGFVILATVAILYLWGAVRERTEALSQANRTLEVRNEELERAYQELRETEAQLVQSEKMASLGQLTAGVAHELNNPVAFLYANVHYLRRSLETLRGQLGGDGRREEVGEVLRQMEELLEGCRNGAERARRIVIDLRTFSRLDEADFKPADLHEGLESTLSLLTYQLKDRIQVHREYGDLPPVVCSPGQINQVWMNLLVNAIQAIEEEGDIWIKTEVDGDSALVSIRDNGVGIPKEHLDRLFTPFFTTKEVGKGVGLGLSVSYGIVQRHGGTITVKSKVGGGSTFTVRLPVEQEIA